MMLASKLQRIPLALTMLRAILGPVVLVFAYLHPLTSVFAVSLVAALLSDYFDGVIARHLGVATPALRRLDSLADTVFYVSALLATWHLHSDLLIPHLIPMVALVVIELIRYVFDYWKFSKEASYHMWSSKLWGLSLFVGFYSLLVFGNGGWVVALAIYLGIVADLEGLAISFVLTKWQTDVPSIFHAIRRDT